jgi:hypothetical protein
MAWSTPPTWTSGQTIPASNLNIIRDDLLETVPAKATVAGRHFASTAANSIAEREIKQDYIAAGGSVTNTSFGNPASGGTGPTVTITTGVLAIVNVQAQMNNSTNGPSTRMSYDITGATTSAATDDRGILQQSDTAKDVRFGAWELQTLTAGSNVFVAKYRVSSTSGTISARTMIVWAL